MIRKLGRFVEFSVFGKKPPSIGPSSAIAKNWTFAARTAPYSYEIAIDLFERGLVTSNGVVTHSYSLNDWDEAFALADSTDSIKVIRFPDPPAVPLLQSRSPARSQWGPAGRQT